MLSIYIKVVLIRCSLGDGHSNVNWSYWTQWRTWTPVCFLCLTLKNCKAFMYSIYFAKGVYTRLYNVPSRCKRLLIFIFYFLIKKKTNIFWWLYGFWKYHFDSNHYRWARCIYLYLRCITVRFLQVFRHRFDILWGGFTHIYSIFQQRASTA